MSGIVALFQRDQRPVDPLHLSSMLDRIAHRGPDGSEIWTEGSVGLGQCLLRTTPESLQEILPRREPELQLVIAADARLDNRPDLIEALQLRDRPPHSLTDSYLIGAAYRRWGEDSPSYLLGDFAYVIWDLHHQHLFCARDHLGVKPLYLYLTSEVAILASELQGLLAHPHVPRQIDEGWVAGFLAQTGQGALDPITDPQSSPFQDLQPLPAGHWLRVGFERHHQTSYWQLDPERSIDFATDQEAVEAFKDLFSRVVTCRLRCHTPIGIQLSGGLDSSSITAMALQHLGGNTLHAFTTTFDDFPFPGGRRAEESRYYQAVLQQGCLPSHLLASGQISPLRDPNRQLHVHPDSPFSSFGMCYFRTVYRAAQGHQIRVVLSGSGGDSVVSHGLDLLGQLAQSGQWLRLMGEIEVARTLQHSPSLTFLSLLWGYQIKPKLIRGPLKRLWDKGQRLHHPSVPRVLNSQLICRTELRQRRAARSVHRRQYATLRGRHYLGIVEGLLETLPCIDRTAAGLGIEARHPFYDKRLVEFCLSLPIEMKLKQGYSRWILRQSMTGLLPPLVQWRHHKADLTPIQVGNFLIDEKALIGAVLSGQGYGSDGLATYLNPEALAELAHLNYELYQNRSYIPIPVVQRASLIWRIVTLSIWISAQTTGSLSDP